MRRSACTSTAYRIACSCWPARPTPAPTWPMCRGTARARQKTRDRRREITWLSPHLLSRVSLSDREHRMIIIINGPLGIGKTQASWALVRRFPRAVMLDVDYVAEFHPFDYYNDEHIA